MKLMVQFKQLRELLIDGGVHLHKRELDGGDFYTSAAEKVDFLSEVAYTFGDLVEEIIENLEIICTL
jgi:hypothetical protein